MLSKNLNVKTRFLILLVAAAGCAGSSSDLSMQLRETPFRQLRGVHLGMTGRQLHAVRPQARYAPYLGLQERVPGYAVAYDFASAQGDKLTDDVAPDDELRGIYITQTHESEDAAARAWSEATRALARDRRAPHSCERFPAGGVQARWISGDAVIAIGAFPREPNAPNVGPRVIFAVSPKETLKQPEGGTTIPCPTEE